MREEGSGIMDGNQSSYVGDSDAILPEGWQPGEDLLADAQTDSDGANLDEIAGETKGDSDLLAEATAGKEAVPDKQTEAQAETGRQGRKIKIKYNHRQEEVDVNALTDDDLAAIIQKSRAYDADQKRKQGDKYRQAYQQELDAGMTEAAARLVAKEAAGGEYPLEDEQEQEEPPVNASVLRGEIEQLKALYPDLKEIPDEVATLIAKGAPALAAYSAYRDKLTSEKISALEAENKALKQNAEARKRAPVKGTTGGAATKEPDIFELGFDSGNRYNW